jgi:hypothetical protein
LLGHQAVLLNLNNLLLLNIWEHESCQLKLGVVRLFLIHLYLIPMHFSKLIGKLLLVIAFTTTMGCAPDYLPVQVKGLPLLGGVFDGLWYPRTELPVSGILRFSDGRVYEGRFIGGGMDEGSMKYPDGREIVGRFHENVAVYGTLKFSDGRVYMGGLKGSVAQGQGTMEYPNGDTLTGTFKAGRASGPALEMKADGSRYYGPFKDGAKAGIGYCFSDGQAGTCSRKGEKDNAEEALRDRGAERASKKMRDDAKEAQAKLDKEFNDRQAKIQDAITDLRNRRARQEGPTRENDFNCYCTIATACLGVIGNNEVVDKEKERLQDERRTLMCRDKYAEWLQIAKLPDFAKRKAALDQKIVSAQNRIDAENLEKERRRKALDAEWTRREADKAAMARLRDAERLKEEALWKKRAQDEVARCSKAPLRPTDCRCRAVLKIVEKPVRGAVCEA